MQFIELTRGDITPAFPAKSEWLKTPEKRRRPKLFQDQYVDGFAKN